MILGYTLTTFPKSLIQTKTTKRTSTELRAKKRRRTLHNEQEDTGTSHTGISLQSLA